MGVPVCSKMDSGCYLGRWSRDDAAGDAVAGVAGGVGLHVVGLFVDDDGGAPIGDDAVWRGGVKREVVDVEGGLAEVAFADGDVLREVARVVAHGVFEAVLLVVGVEVGAGALEVRAVAEGLGVDVDAVFTYGEVLEVELDLNALFGGAKGGGAGVIAGAGLDGDDDGILRLGEGWNNQKAEGDGGEDVAHRLVLQIDLPHENT